MLPLFHINKFSKLLKIFTSICFLANLQQEDKISSLTSLGYTKHTLKTALLEHMTTPTCLMHGWWNIHRVTNGRNRQKQFKTPGFNHKWLLVRFVVEREAPTQFYFQRLIFLPQVSFHQRSVLIHHLKLVLLTADPFETAGPKVPSHSA